jgi:hypothetical protein
MKVTRKAKVAAAGGLGLLMAASILGVSAGHANASNPPPVPWVLRGPQPSPWVVAVPGLTNPEPSPWVTAASDPEPSPWLV